MGNGSKVKRCVRGWPVWLALLTLVACSSGPTSALPQTPQKISQSLPQRIGPTLSQAGAALPTMAASEEAAPLSDAALIEMGRGIYATNCAPCHQPNGEGNIAIFPALNRNAFVTVSDPTAVIETVLYGREIMPAFAVTLTDTEVAAVISYIRNAWNNEAAVVDVAQVESIRAAANNEE